MCSLHCNSQNITYIYEIKLYPDERECIMCTERSCHSMIAGTTYHLPIEIVEIHLNLSQDNLFPKWYPHQLCLEYLYISVGFHLHSCAEYKDITYHLTLLRFFRSTIPAGWSCWAAFFSHSWGSPTFPCPHSCSPSRYNWWSSDEMGQLWEYCGHGIATRWWHRHWRYKWWVYTAWKYLYGDSAMNIACSLYSCYRL
jgi:hypothetical protein